MTISVIGPALSGATTVAEALRRRLPGHSVREGLSPGSAVVVVVVSAAAPMTRSDWALLDTVGGPAVVAVSKIDVHRTWREVLAANRAGGPDRAAAWVGVAAAPEVGGPRLEDLVEAVLACLSRLSRRPPAKPGSPTTATQVLFHRALIRRAKLELTSQARARSSALRDDLHQRVATVPPRRAEAFRQDVRRRVEQAVADLDRIAAVRLAEIADRCTTPDPPLQPVLPAVRSTDLETRMTVLLGGGFGAGSAVTLDRVLGGTGMTGAAALSLVAGLGLGSWVAHTRRVLSVRAALDRWIDEVTAVLRTALEERVTARVLATEIAVSERFAFARVPDRRYSD